MKISTALCAVLVVTLTAAQAQSGSNDKPVYKDGAGVEYMKSLMESIRQGNGAGQSEAIQKSIKSGVSSASSAAKFEAMDPTTAAMTVHQAEDYNKLAREAFVAALPPKDRPRGQALLLGNGSLPGHQGKLYFFVSRSMPEALLRAYAVDALYTGATLVTKGVRRGDTVKEYIAEVMEDYNSVDNQMLAGIEINPNLFDMFDVKVVPSVVWTNRVGLDENGSGCVDLPEGAPIPQVQLTGPDDKTFMADAPTCAKVPESSYYKIAGALSLPYVLERFEEAGLSKEATAPYKEALAERKTNVFQGQGEQLAGNVMAPVRDFRIDRLPKHVLRKWNEQLKTELVQRGPYGPAFSTEGEDDLVYRKELQAIIDHGLGL